MTHWAAAVLAASEYFAYFAKGPEEKTLINGKNARHMNHYSRVTMHHSITGFKNKNSEHATALTVRWGEPDGPECKGVLKGGGGGAQKKHV